MPEGSFSTRAFIRWEREEKFSEPTSTWVITAANGEFVDTRVNLNNKSKHWFITGFENIVETVKGYDYSIEFLHGLDNFTQWGATPGKDLGHFKEITNDYWNKTLKEFFECKDRKNFNVSHYRLEEGSMPNPDFNEEVQDYQEIWDSLDPINSTPDQLKSLIEPPSEKIPSKVYKLFDVDKETELGRFIKFGKFGMGVAVNDKREYQVIRTYGNNVVYHFGEDYERVFSSFLNNLSAKEPWILTFEG